MKFYQLLEKRLNDKIKNLSSENESKELDVRLVRNTMRKAIDDIFSKSTHKLSHEATTWLTDQYFKAIKINEDQVMNDQVYINEYKLDELKNSDIKLLHDLFSSTKLGVDLNVELQKRTILS